MSEITLIEAITQALAYEMAVDKEVVLLGEDIGINGGVFRATTELFKKALALTRSRRPLSFLSPFV